MKQETYNVMEYTELEKIVEEHFGRNYEYVADVEVGNDTIQKHFVESEHLYAPYSEPRLEDFRNGGWPCYMIHDILTELAQHGKIPEGYLLVEVSW